MWGIIIIIIKLIIVISNYIAKLRAQLRQPGQKGASSRVKAASHPNLISPIKILVATPFLN